MLDLVIKESILLKNMFDKHNQSLILKNYFNKRKQEEK
jgi:hypothetical protein